MPATNKTSGKTPQDPPVEQALAVTGGTEAANTAVAPAHAGGIFGGEFAPSSARLRRGGRMLGWIVLALIVVLVVASIGTWVRFQSLHITSTNAVVRGHLGEIGTQLHGIVTTVEVDAGDRVQAGQVLVRLDDRQLRSEVSEARATIDGLKRELEVERLAITHERQRIKQQLVESAANLRAAEAQRVAAQIRVQDARRFHRLREELFAAGGAISGEDVRDAESKWRTAEALYAATEAEKAAAASAQDKVRLGDDAATIRERRIGVLEAKVLQAQARLSQAEAGLEDATIRAPEDGAIVRRIVQAGGSVKVGQPIIAMWFGNDVWIEAWIDEEDITDVALNNRATVTLLSFPGRELVGTVDKIGLATDYEMPESEVPQPRFSRMRGAPVVGVRIKLDNPPAELLPGLSAAVSIQRRTK